MGNFREFEINATFPIPGSEKVENKRKIHYPFDELLVGESFAEFCDENELPATAHRVRAALNRFQSSKAITEKFKTRTVREDGKAGIRVWRTQ